IEVSAISASSVAATRASPLVWEPETALENLRRYGRWGAILADKLMLFLSPSNGFKTSLYEHELLQRARKKKVPQVGTFFVKKRCASNLRTRLTAAAIIVAEWQG